MPREIIKIRVFEQDTRFDTHRLCRIFFQEPVNFQTGEELQIELALGMDGMFILEAYKIRKEEDAKEKL